MALVPLFWLAESRGELDMGTILSSGFNYFDSIFYLLVFGLVLVLVGGIFYLAWRLIFDRHK